RRELLERALAELVVVVVDLSGTLGGDDDERVAAVDVLEQLVDAWLDHAPMLAVGAGALHDRDDLVDGSAEIVVLPHVVEEAGLAELALGDVEALADPAG